MKSLQELAWAAVTAIVAYVVVFNIIGFSVNQAAKSDAAAAVAMPAKAVLNAVTVSVACQQSVASTLASSSTSSAFTLDGQNVSTSASGGNVAIRVGSSGPTYPLLQPVWTSCSGGGTVDTGHVGP